MRSSFGQLRLGKLALFLTVSEPRLRGSATARQEERQSSRFRQPNEQKRAVHALNRLTFGPRPGDVQQVMAMGVDRWIDLQLHPEKISDSAVEARLAPFRTLRMSSKEIVEEFPDNQMIQQVHGRQEVHAFRSRASAPCIQVQIARLQEKQQKKTERKTSGQIAGRSPQPRLPLRPARRATIPRRPLKNSPPLPPPAPTPRPPIAMR